MTDKQIIIDGEQCQYLSDTGLCRLVYNLTEKSYDCSMCKKNPNCYYKQLKRAEQRIVELNKTIQTKEQKCERLKSENYELKEEVSIDKALFAEIDQLKAENDELEKELRQKKMTILMNNDHYFEVDQENKKLKQTLTEIKEIVGIGLVDGLEPEEYGGFLKILQAQILQKISEVEE